MWWRHVQAVETGERDLEQIPPEEGSKTTWVGLIAWLQAPFFLPSKDTPLEGVMGLEILLFL